MIRRIARSFRATGSALRADCRRNVSYGKQSKSRQLLSFPIKSLTAFKGGTMSVIHHVADILTQVAKHKKLCLKLIVALALMLIC